MAGVLSSLRYLLADVIGDDDEAPPFLPDGLPEGAAPTVSEGIHLLIDYQGASYAALYVQNPEFGFYFLRLASARLFQNIATLEQRLAQQIAYAAPKPA